MFKRENETLELLVHRRQGKLAHVEGSSNGSENPPVWKSNSRQGKQKPVKINDLHLFAFAMKKLPTLQRLESVKT